MLKSYRYRLYPTEDQKEVMAPGIKKAMKEKKYIISKNGRTVSSITRAGSVTISDAAAGIAYSEPDNNFLAFLDQLSGQGYNIKQL